IPNANRTWKWSVRHRNCLVANRVKRQPYGKKWKRASATPVRAIPRERLPIGSKHDLWCRGVVGHRDLARWRRGRWVALRPCCPIPARGGVEAAAWVGPAEHDDVAAGYVVAHRMVEPRRGSVDLGSVSPALGDEGYGHESGGEAKRVHGLLLGRIVLFG